MYAVIETGGKQQKVLAGDILDVELLDNSKSVTFSNVLLIADGDQVSIGTPYVKGAKVSAKVIGNVKDDKVTSLKYKRKVNYHRTIGHRQNYTRVQIEEIKNGS
ncbi:MAG: 50S ribosomal protein L21 [Candidatus Margulisbacteria bacterium]|jgi:large subunit ribosomal protein L21|nr:50S ribosomal protein L21 [Candidatus Margulisiibacteriota bacterium]